MRQTADERLWSGVHQRDEAAVRAALRDGADPNAVAGTQGIKGRWTVLMAAVSLGFVDAARDLLERGAQVNARDQRDRTPLMILATTDASGEAARTLTRALLAFGADAFLEDMSSTNALMAVAGHGALEVFDELLNGVVDIDRPNSQEHTVDRTVGAMWIGSQRRQRRALVAAHRDRRALRAVVEAPPPPGAPPTKTRRL